MYAYSGDFYARYNEQELLRVATPAEQWQALDDASFVIDGYIGGRYTLPLVNPPKMLTILCCDIARYLLHDKNVPEVVKDRYDQAITMLEKFGTGKLSLYPAASSDNKTADLVEFKSSPAVFGRDKSKGFI